jgi:hypothetical protein
MIIHVINVQKIHFNQVNFIKIKKKEEGKLECENCKIGTIAPEEGSITCKNCEKGQKWTGVGVCTDCEINTYQPGKFNIK